MNSERDSIRQMHIAIQAASIARQAWDHMREGRGAPDVRDMLRFREEAEAIAELWEESLEASK
ncbi:MAG: hypothetical protein KC766_12070 [Myxococcales bacterium]|nr:hypothetical protein [Myxococcales bacterium]